MRQIVALALCHLWCVVSVVAATQPIYVNNSPVQVLFRPQVAPQIDATAFVNQSLFQINDIYFTGLPYQTFNTLYFTNTSSGNILGDMGYRFDFSSGNTRGPMYSFLNDQGTISGDTFLLVNATNIVSTGPLLTGSQGLMRLTGNSIKLSGNALRAGFVGSGFATGSGSVSNYLNPDGVSDIWAGAGTNNVVSGAGSPMQLDPSVFNAAVFDLSASNFQSAVHQVIYAGFPSTNTFQLPLPSGGPLPGTGFGAYAFRRNTSSTSSVVQVVFVRTNSFDTNLSVNVSFQSDSDEGADAIVQFSYPEFDVVDRTFSTNYFYLIDKTAFSTNIALARNLVGQGRRPNTYNLIRSMGAPYFGVQSAVPPNTPYSGGLLYNTGYASNAVPVVYAAYAGSVAPITITTATDPTNYPGRIEIAGDRVNLEQTRIRAESTVVIRTGDLASNKLARVDAPFSVFDLTSHQPEMVISNFIPAAIQRLNGQFYAWSATWQNAQGPNQIKFHVLMVDHFLSSAFRSQIYRLALHAPHLTIADPVAVGQAMVLDARSMDVTGSLTLPSGASWGNTNVIELYNFTNHGVISVSQTALAGTDRPNPYDNYVNIGTNTAATHLIRTKNFEDSGSLVASSGLLSISANTMTVAGAPPVTNISTTFIFTNTVLVPVLVTNSTIVGATLQSSSAIGITANSLILSNAVFQTGVNGGSLDLSISNNLSDAGVAALSTWFVGGSFRLLNLPTNANLLGTHILATARRNSEVFHAWCAEDRGATAAGFTNNAAVGKLTLDAGDFSIIHFSTADPSKTNAIYVDYLELLGSATNVNTQLAIDPNFTIYFANANVQASKLDGAANGRLRWVKSFTGPLSSASYTYAITNIDGQVVYTNYVFNAAFAGDKDLDSDGDNTVNAEDPTPIYTSASVGLKVLKTKGLPPAVLVQWNGLRGVTNRLEYRNSLSVSNWNLVTNIVPPGPLSGPVTIRDPFPPVSTNALERIYRVTVFPPP